MTFAIIPRATSFLSSASSDHKSGHKRFKSSPARTEIKYASALIDLTRATSKAHSPARSLSRSPVPDLARWISCDSPDGASPTTFRAGRSVALKLLNDLLLSLLYPQRTRFSTNRCSLGGVVGTTKVTSSGIGCLQTPEMYSSESRRYGQRSEECEAKQCFLHRRPM
jgi:hypothetical protein